VPRRGRAVRAAPAQEPGPALSGPARVSPAQEAGGGVPAQEASGEGVAGGSAEADGEGDLPGMPISGSGVGSG